MTDSARDAIVVMAVVTPFALALWVYGRWREGDLQPRREALVIAGTVAWALILAAAFAGPPAVASLVPSVGLLAGGTWWWFSRPQDPLRIGALLAIMVGSLGILTGALLLVSS